MDSPAEQRVAFLQKPDERLTSFDQCKLGRKEFAERLTSIVQSLTQPFVIALDSPWGTGKTTFLDMWENTLRERGAPCLKFNAWENDFVDDPMTAFIAEIGSGVKRLHKDKAITKGTIDKWDKVKDTSIAVGKAMLPILLKMATKGYSEQLEEVLKRKGVADGLGELATAVTKASLDSYDKQKSSVKDFKLKLGKFAAALHQEKRTWEGPLVILVDELDRCRPDFTISLLERIKHLFNVDGIVFVLALDMDAIDKTVHHVYGELQDNMAYLARFIDLPLSLPDPPGVAYASHVMANLRMSEALKRWDGSIRGMNEVPVDKCMLILSNSFSLMAKEWNLGLRVQNRIITRINLLLRSIDTGLNVKRAHFNPRAYELMIFLLHLPFILAFLKMADGPRYRAMLEGRFVNPSELFSKTVVEDKLPQDLEIRMAKSLCSKLLNSIPIFFKNPDKFESDAARLANQPARSNRRTQEQLESEAWNGTWTYCLAVVPPEHVYHIVRCIDLLDGEGL